MKDHKQIGVEQELYYFNELVPGCCFFLPHGTRVYNALKNHLEKEYWKRGFHEVVTPQLAKKELWQVSGHWDKYRDDMFTFMDSDKESAQEYGLKAMNCPGHCLIFKSRNRSYTELPLRLADFGMLHRNENSGSLHGLLRTKCFQQDDAHIFCRKEQIRQEIEGSLDFLESIYGKFGLEFDLELSTRPEKFIGDEAIWNMAEEQLRLALKSYAKNTGKEWKISKNSGAFYGPKIDIHVKDSLGRSHQCATIQLDFNLPSQERFALKFANEKDELEEPVIIHRAIYGSFGRFMAILTEHYQGKWPFWLSPRQVKVIPISEKFLGYAETVAQQIHEKGFYVDVDRSDNTIPKKIALAQVEQYNYILVVGKREMDKGTVNVRYRDVKEKKEITIAEIIEELSENII